MSHPEPKTIIKIKEGGGEKKWDHGHEKHISFNLKKKRDKAKILNFNQILYEFDFFFFF